MKSNRNGKLILLGITLLCVAGGIFINNSVGSGKKIQKGIANNVIRFHVIANSDMEQDQELKLAVKDKIVASVRGELKEANDLESARKILKSKLTKMEKIAEQEMKKRGYSYKANATFSSTYFPVKSYGDLTFPDGEYEAVRVNLGEAKGKNWWCVMYPTLCFVDSTYQVVPEESKEVLKKDLTRDEYQSLLKGENVSYGFKLIEWVEKFF